MKTCSKAGELALVAPRDADAVRALLDPGTTPTTPRPRCAVLWLDDREPFTAQGVTINDLREWRDSRPGWIVAATYGGKGGDQVAANETLRTLAGNILRRCRRRAGGFA